MRVLMTGGGTAGHINPALAIASAIKQNIGDAEIAFVGTPGGMENNLVSKAGYKMYHVDVAGFKRSLSPKNIRAAYLAFVSPIKAKSIVKEYKPDIVIGTGGYVSWPILVAAAKLGVKTAVHESNAVPGVTVKKLAKFVDRIYVGYSESARYISHKEKIIYTGSPLRDGFLCADKTGARKSLGISEKYKTVILSFGGSLGAMRLNDAMLELMKDYVRFHDDVLHIHASGSIEYGDMKKQFIAAGLDKCENIQLLEYINDMPLKMAAADIVISRAGAMTISELAIMKKASIFVPSPNVTNNQQFKNASVLVDAGGAMLIEEKDLGGGTITAKVQELIENPDKRERMENEISRFAMPDANKIIIKDIMQLLEK